MFSNRKSRSVYVYIRTVHMLKYVICTYVKVYERTKYEIRIVEHQESFYNRTFFDLHVHRRPTKMDLLANANVCTYVYRTYVQYKAFVNKLSVRYRIDEYCMHTASDVFFSPFLSLILLG